MITKQLFTKDELTKLRQGPVQGSGWTHKVPGHQTQNPVITSAVNTLMLESIFETLYRSPRLWSLEVIINLPISSRSTRAHFAITTSSEKHNYHWPIKCRPMSPAHKQITHFLSTTFIFRRVQEPSDSYPTACFLCWLLPSASGWFAVHWVNPLRVCIFIFLVIQQLHESSVYCIEQFDI